MRWMATFLLYSLNSVWLFKCQEHPSNEPGDKEDSRGTTQQQWCARTAPWSSVNLLTHTGSIMSPSSHPPLPSLAVSLALSALTLSLSLPSPPTAPPPCFCFASVSSLWAGPQHQTTTSTQHGSSVRLCGPRQRQSPGLSFLALM